LGEEGKMGENKERFKDIEAENYWVEYVYDDEYDKGVIERII